MGGRELMMCGLGLVLGGIGGALLFAEPASPRLSPAQVEPVITEASAPAAPTIDVAAQAEPTPLLASTNSDCVPAAAQLNALVEQLRALPGDDGELISERLLSFARTRFRDEGTRLYGHPPSAADTQTAMTDFRDSVLNLPGGMAAAWAKAALKGDELARAFKEAQGTVLLELLGDDLSALANVDYTGEILDHSVTSRSRQRAVDGSAFASSKDPVGEGMILSFGPGVHELAERRLRDESGLNLPSDVTLLGAGINGTLLKLSDISIRGDVERLTLRDMTIDCDNDGLFDLRSGGLTLDMQRVRIVRFDAGHGGADIFAPRGGLFLRLDDCEILGGYGRSPGNGDLFDVGKGPVLGRFRNCQIELLGLRFPSATQLVFESCSFDLLRPGALDSPALSLMNCSFGNELDSGNPKQNLARDFAIDFPQWN